MSTYLLPTRYLLPLRPALCALEVDVTVERWVDPTFNGHELELTNFPPDGPHNSLLARLRRRRSLSPPATSAECTDWGPLSGFETDIKARVISHTSSPPSPPYPSFNDTSCPHDRLAPTTPTKLLPTPPWDDPHYFCHAQTLETRTLPTNHDLENSIPATTT